MSIISLENKYKEEHSSLFQSSQYYLENLYSACKESASMALPGVSAAISFIALSILIHPEPFFNEVDEEDLDIDSHFVIQDEKQMDHVLKFYADYGIKIDKNIPVNRTFKQKMLDAVQASILSYLKLIREFNEKYNTSVKLCVGIQEDGQDVLFPTIGGTWSKSGPLIEYKLPRLEIGSIESPTKNTSSYFYLSKAEIASQFEPLEKRFIIAHEFSHVINNDAFIKVACQCATSLFSALPWFLNFSESSWASYIVKSYTQSLTVETVSRFFQSMLSRHLEQRADLQAMDFLESSQGAILFFENLKQQPDQIRDFEHPPIETRLKVAKQWQKDHLEVS